MDDIIFNKAASIERCMQRIQEEYSGVEDQLDTNYTKQDAIILNLLRACETAIDMGAHIIKVRALGLPQSSRDIFAILEQANIISAELSRQMQAMVGFRNIAVHNYTKLDLSILRAILEKDLPHLIEFSSALIQC